MLLDFKCYQDEDVEAFLNYKAIDFLNKKLASTFLLFDKSKYDAGQKFVEAYFSFAVKPIRLDGLSSNFKKRLSLGNASADIHTFMLVGQFGKYKREKTSIDSGYDSRIKSSEMFDIVLMYVAKLLELIPFRFMLVECKEEVYKMGIYQDLGFKPFPEQPINPDNGLYRLYMKTPKI